MSKMIDVRHIENTIAFLTAKRDEYNEMAESYKRQDFEALGNWYEGRGGAFGSAADYLQSDIDHFSYPDLEIAQ